VFIIIIIIIIIKLNNCMHRNWNNVVDIMTMQRGGRSGVRLPTGSRVFSLRQNVQTASRLTKPST